MASTIDNENKLINGSDKKVILSALNRINKAFNEINKLGYSIYVTSDSVNVMVDKTQNSSDVIAAVSVYGIDCGAW